MGLLTKILSPLKRAVEGEPRPGPYWLPLTGGWLPDGTAMNWWQLGQNIQSLSPSALVEACIAAYSQTISQCPGDHWKSTGDGGRERVTTSAIHRLLRYPNDYETTSNFLLNLVRWLYVDGNAYAVAIRNDRYEIEQLHLMDSRHCQALIATTGDVFYSLSGNYIVDRLLPPPLIVPARDVLHVRINESSSTRPLCGESPLIAAARDIAVSDAILGQQIQFYLNQARPSTVLTTDMVLDKDQVNALRDRWNEQSRGLNAGGTPILTAGLKPVPLASTSKDAELAEVAKMSQQNIAMAFGVPLQILGIGGTGSTTEELMRSWLSRSLGFLINHIEESFNQIYGLKGYPDEWVEFDTDALLRMAQKDRIEALARGVQGGIYSPNEARQQENLPKVKFGDEPRVQQQVVPLSAAAGIPAAPAPSAPPAAPPSPMLPAKQGVTNAERAVRAVKRLRITQARISSDDRRLGPA